MNNEQPNYREVHVFDPIHNGADECECGLTADANIHPRRTATPLAVPNDAEELARQIIGTVFDNTGASHETLKQVMVKRITDAIVVGHISSFASTSDSARRAAEEWINTYHGAFKTNREREDALAAIITKHCPAATVAQSLIVAFRDSAIKCHIGFKHEGSWEECEWIECKDRRGMIE